MTSEEIARIAKVSRSTVSRVINNYSNVPESTRQKVQEVIDFYGYTPNHSARILAGKTNPIIGVFLADICLSQPESPWHGVTSPYNMEILSHVIQFSKKHGYLTLIDTIEHTDQCQTMEQHFRDRTIHGAIFIGFPYRTQILEEIASKGYNIVLIDQLSDSDDPDKQIKRINTDNISGGYLATKHLIEQGHTHILHVAGDNRLSSLERTKGYLKALEEANLKPAPILQGNYNEGAAYAVTQDYLNRHPSGQRATAIFSANDIMTLGIRRAIFEKGLSVPDDISIVGFDNLQLSTVLGHNLSTMHICKQELAHRAVSLLLSDSFEPVSLRPQLVSRNSVSKPKNFLSVGD